MSTITASTAATHAPFVRHLAQPAFSGRSVALVAAAHAGALMLLASMDLLPIVPPVSTLMVSLVPPALPVQSEPVPEITRPLERKALPPRPVPAPHLSQLVATPAEAGATAAPAPQREAPPPAPASAATISQPRFDADYLSNPAPHYPALSRRLGEEGKVVLRVQVDAGGRPSQIEVRTSSGSSRLDNAAQEAVSRWKFIPAKRGDEAIAAWVLVPIVFNLKTP